MEYHNKTIVEVAKLLNTSISKGLSPVEAQSRLEKEGKNKLPEAKKPNIFLQFLGQFKDFMVVILIVSAVVSAVVEAVTRGNNYIDSIMIIAIVLFNGIIGLLQENKANHSLEKLKAMAQPEVEVYRNGVMKIPSQDVVVGDLLLLTQGEYIAADCRIIEANALQINESALTGESVASVKEVGVLPLETALADRTNLAYMGTSVVQGRGKAIVIATGVNTEVGHISRLLENAPTQATPLQNKLSEIGKILGLGALGICFVIFIIGILRQIPVFTMFMTSISLAVAAIPEGLPAIVTIILAIGVQTMAKNNAIVKTLSAVEALGNATVICSDKTGTLTENKMRVVETNGQRDLLMYATLCCDASASSGTPTEMAIVQGAEEIGYFKDSLEMDMPRVKEFPFTSQRKMMTTVHKYKGEYIEITKGATEYVLEKCSFYYENGKKPITATAKKKILEQNNTYGRQALRVLAIAIREASALPQGERDLCFYGLVALADSPRKGVRQAVEKCTQAGIRTIMITGDNPQTAEAIGKKIGITSNIVTGNDLDAMESTEFENVVNSCNIFARVSPKHKFQIVESLKSKGEIVAMTGDGVNDAPALKSANIGCAMGLGGTDVARASSDLILADDNFTTIVRAIKSGREMYENVKKAVHFLLSSNIGEIITIFVALVLGYESPLCPVQLLWVNLVTDSLPAIALGLDPCQENIMARKPEKNNRIFTVQMWENIGIEGVMIGTISLLAFSIGKVIFHNDTIGSTMCFATLSICQLVHAFNMRTTKSLLTINIFSNGFLVLSLVLGVFLQGAVIEIPVLSQIFRCQGLNAVQWAIVAGLSLVPILLCEAEKYVAMKNNL